MKYLHCFALSCLVFAAASAHAGAPASFDSTQPEAAASPWPPAMPPYTEAGLSRDQAIDAAIDELNLLDPDLGEDRVLELLDGLFAAQAPAAQPMGDATATGTGYLAHRKWGGSNGYVVDRFNSHPDGIHRARAAARLANGDVVVVGDIESDIAHNRSLGIVKYDSRGQRVTWTGVSGDFGVFSNQYIRFPGGNAWGNTREVIWVHQVMATSTHIYVLLTVREGTGSRRPAVMRWRHDGSGFNWNLTQLPDSGTYRDAVAMDIWGHHMIVLGRRSIDIDDGDGGFWVRRYTINADGGLGTVGNAANVTPLATVGNRRFIPADIAFRRSSVDAPVEPPAFAGVATVRITSDQRTRACLYKYVSNNSHTGYYCPTNFEDGRRHWAAAVHTHAQTFATAPLVREVLFMSSTVHYDRADAIRLTKLVNDVPDTTFGNAAGNRIYGGCSDEGSGSGEGCAPSGIPPTAHIPLNKALYADTDGVYVAGRTFRAGRAGGPPTRRPIFMHVDPDSGELISLQLFGNSPNSRFAALVPGKTGSGGVREFTVVGHGYSQEHTQPDPVAPSHFLSAHLVRRGDLIFHNGLQPEPPLSEGFQAIATLPTAGWVMRNNSTPLGTTSWYQGHTNVFHAQAGAADSYIAANYNNTSGIGTISNWLITPRLTFGNASSLSFWTRRPVSQNQPDRLEVRLCTGSPCTDVGNTATSVGGFTTVLLTINPALAPGGYPQVWTQYTLTSAQGLPTSGHGRVAFRYFVTDAGVGSNSNYIGIDTVAIQATGIDGAMAPDVPASTEGEP